MVAATSKPVYHAVQETSVTIPIAYDLEEKSRASGRGEPAATEKLVLPWGLCLVKLGCARTPNEKTSAPTDLNLSTCLVIKRPISIEIIK